MDYPHGMKKKKKNLQLYFERELSPMAIGLLCLSTLHGTVIFPQRRFVVAHPAASGLSSQPGYKMADASVNSKCGMEGMCVCVYFSVWVKTGCGAYDEILAEKAKSVHAHSHPLSLSLAHTYTHTLDFPNPLGKFARKSFGPRG